MKRTIVVLAALGIVALGAVPASAHMQDYQGAKKAVLFQNTGSEIVWPIRWQCSNGESASVTVRIRQGTQSTSISSGLTCSGSPSVAFVDFDGTGFHYGLARGSVRWEFSDNNVFTNSRDIQIVQCGDVWWCV